MVVAGGKGAAASRLQSNAKVLPHGQGKPADGEDTSAWDDRSYRQILWGAAREHTLMGFYVTLVHGEAPKLCTLPQATQLLSCVLMGSLFLSTLQLRYTWLGGKVLFGEVSTDADLAARMPIIWSVAIVAALLCLPMILVARWVFLLASRSTALSVRLLEMMKADEELLKPQTGKGSLWIDGASKAAELDLKREVQWIFGSAWSIVLLGIFAGSVGAINMSFNMEASLVEQDVMLAFAFGVILYWLAIEPIMLVLFGSVGVLLKWCTTFEDIVDDAARAAIDACNEMEVSGRPLKVNEARPRPDRGPRREPRW